jgi:uncharacterized Tic20 family protein
MKQLKRFLGLIWMLTGPVIIFILVKAAIHNIDVNGKSDINKPVPWIIIILIFTPIAIGLTIFGWYAWKGEYDKIKQSSE